jgi:[ribosomal protein S5]-alanine N-acetyltransferase
MNLENLFHSFPQISTQNLVLRRMQATDAEALFGILSDERVTQYYDDETFGDIQQASEQIAAWENGYQSRRCIRWGITLKDDPTLIGTCGYYGFHTWHMRAGIGYELRQSFWRKGIMTEALRAIIHLGFKELGLNRIEAVVMPENTASIRLLEKLGFCREGLLREYENWGAKGFANLWMLGLLREEWEGQERDERIIP